MLCCAADRSERVGWWIVLVSFYADAFALGGRALFSIVMIYFEREWNMTRQESSSIMAIIHVGQAFTTPASGHLADNMPAYVAVGGGIWYLAFCFGLTAVMASRWQVYLIYGVFSGIAYGVLNLNVFSAAITHAMPPSRRGIAIGIATSGSTVGQLLLLPVFSYVCSSLGWRSGYVALCCCTAVLGLCSIVALRPGAAVPPSSESADVAIAAPRQVASTEPSTEMAAATDGAATAERQPASDAAEGKLDADASSPSLRSKLRAMATSRAYALLTVAFFACGVTTTGFMETHIVGLTISMGMSGHTGALAFSFLSACNGVGMVLAGYLTDRISRPAILTVPHADGSNHPTSPSHPPLPHAPFLMASSLCSSLMVVHCSWYICPEGHLWRPRPLLPPPPRSVLTHHSLRLRGHLWARRLQRRAADGLTTPRDPNQIPWQERSPDCSQRQTSVIMLLEASSADFSFHFVTHSAGLARRFRSRGSQRRPRGGHPAHTHAHTHAHAHAHEHPVHVRICMCACTCAHCM